MKNATSRTVLLLGGCSAAIALGWGAARGQISVPQSSTKLVPPVATIRMVPPVATANPEVSGPLGLEVQRRMDASAQLTRAGQKSLSSSDLPGAENDFRLALSLYGYNSKAALELAKILEQRGRAADALTYYQLAFDETPQRSYYSTFPADVEALARYGALCEQNGQWAKAVQVYSQARERLNPKPELPLSADFVAETRETLRLRAMLNVVRGLALDAQGKSDEALAAFTEATHSDPNQPQAQFYLGRGLQKAGRTAEAKAALEKAARFGSSDVQAAVQKALVKR